MTWAIHPLLLAQQQLAHILKVALMYAKSGTVCKTRDWFQVHDKQGAFHLRRPAACTYICTSKTSRPDVLTPSGHPRPLPKCG